LFALGVSGTGYGMEHNVNRLDTTQKTTKQTALEVVERGL